MVKVEDVISLSLVNEICVMLIDTIEYGRKVESLVDNAKFTCTENWSDKAT